MSGFALVLSGCLGGQTGTEFEDGGGRAPTTDNGAQCSGDRVETADASAGFSVEQAVALVNGTPGLALAWGAGGVTDVGLRVAENAETGCEKGGVVEAPVLVTIRTGDGRVSTTRVPGALTVRGTSAGLESVTLSAFASCTAGAPSSWAIACGVSGFDLAGFDGVEVEVTASFAPGGAVQGSLEVSGAHGGGCTGGGDGACSSPTWELIERAEFSNP